MKHYTVAEIDLRKYKSITGPLEVVGGSRPRLTLTHSEHNQRYFFKTYTHNSREVWAECAASHIAELIGLKAQQVTIKVAPEGLVKAMQARYGKVLPPDWQPIGTLARNIFPRGIDITYGQAVVNTPSTPLTLEDIEHKIRARYYAPEDILQAFSDMVVFDIFIGNMDRHHENWGVCEHERYKQLVLFNKKDTVEHRYFTPLFDHGSSLMFELSDKDITNMLNDESRLLKYVDDNKFGFLLSSEGEPINPFALLQQHLSADSKWKLRFIASLKRVSNIDLLALSEIILQMPTNKMLHYSIERRSLLYKSLLLRYNRLSKLLEGTP